MDSPTRIPGSCGAHGEKDRPAEVSGLAPFPIDVLVKERHPKGKEVSIMWDTVQTNPMHLSHDRPCPGGGHAAHTFLACSDTCDCARTVMPGADRPTLVQLAA